MSSTAGWVDEEQIVLVGYGTAMPMIADTTGGVIITVDNGSVASSVFVAGAASA